MTFPKVTYVVNWSKQSLKPLTIKQLSQIDKPSGHNHSGDEHSGDKHSGDSVSLTHVCLLLYFNR